MTTDLLSVIAALIAAALSGLTLFATTKREERQWRRDSQVEVIVRFLDSTFRLPGNRAYLQLAGGLEPHQLRPEARAALDDCATALTRLRLLAPNSLVQEATQLHELDEQITDRLLFSPAPLPDRDEWISLADARMVARTKVLDAARRGLGLDAARAFEPTRHRRAV